LSGESRLRRQIVRVHGGGVVAGSNEGIANCMRVLAGRGCTTIAVEYSTGYGMAESRHGGVRI
jgi:acetyl esterase/lipase